MMKSTNSIDLPSSGSETSIRDKEETHVEP